MEEAVKNKVAWPGTARAAPHRTERVGVVYNKLPVLFNHTARRGRQLAFVGIYV
jgi:hypothetical protein